MAFKILTAPLSTPKPSLRGEAGLLDMSHRIYIEKVCLVSSIMFSGEEQCYARDILKEQLDMGWAGLTREVEEICQKLGLPNACQQFVHREQVLDHARLRNLKKVKEDMEGLSKMDQLKMKDLRKAQKYMEMVSLEDARLEFRWRTGMLDNRGCMRNKYTSKNCPHCREGREEGVEETSLHWIDCSAYRELRQGLDPLLVQKDRVLYLRRVQLLRKVLEKNT